MGKKGKRKVSVLDEWDDDSKNIHELQKQTIQLPYPALHNNDVKTCLEQLHDKYVYAPAVKAANNVIIIYKHFYYCKITRIAGF